MAIADDFSVAVNGDIRFTGAAANYTVLELHRFLQNLADDSGATGDDLVDITSDTPSDRSTDNIITLLGTYNINDSASEHLFGGSITQAAGDTVYSGLQVLGAVNTDSSQLMIIQDNDNYQFTAVPDAPFWGDQNSGGYNGNATAGILMRCMVKTRQNGADINGKRIRVQSRHWGDTNDFFNVTLGQGEAVAAIGTTPDAQNDTLQGTVTAYSHVTNTEGFQLIDLNNTNGNREYYSKWTFGADTSGDGNKGIWEYIKDLTSTNTAKSNYGVAGDLFLGITHAYPYNGLSGTFTENETVVWGTAITYGTLAGGTFTAGDYVTIGANGAAGKVLYDNGTTQMVVALEDTGITLLDADVITELGAGSTTAAINVTIVDNDKAGGEGLLLADDGVSDHYIQLLTGSAPVNLLEVRGISSAATANVNGSVISKTVPKIFLGSYTGSLIGAYGIGMDPGDLTASDTLEDLAGVTQTPPNNVTFTVSGLVSGEDRVLVGPRLAGVLYKGQDSCATLLSGVAETTIDTQTAIPSDTPTSGTIRVQTNTGVYRRQTYNSYNASQYAIDSSDYSGDNASVGNDIFISYIDKTADAATATFTSVFDVARDLFVRVRDGGATPIKTFEAPATLGSGGGSVAAIRTTDE